MQEKDFSESEFGFFINREKLLKKYPKLLVDQIHGSYMSMGFTKVEIEKLEKDKNPSKEVLKQLKKKKIALKQREIELEAGKKVLKSINDNRPDVAFNLLIYKQLYHFENERYLSLRAKEATLHAILKRQQNYLVILILSCTLVIILLIKGYL